MRSGVLLFLLLVCTAAYAAPACAAASDDLAALLDDREEDYLRRHPSTAISRGDGRYHERFENDLTSAYLAEERELNRAYSTRLAAIERDLLTADERMSYDILRWELDDMRDYLSEGIAEALQMLPVNQIRGRHLDFAREMQWRSRYPFNRVEDFEWMISRMDGFAHWIDDAILQMRTGAAQRITLPRIIVERLIEQVAPLADGRSERTGFTISANRISETIAEPERERLSSTYNHTIEEMVIPAYGRLRTFLSGEYLEAARATVGLSEIPNGREIYLHNVRNYTTTALSPDAIHAIGLSEIARIAVEMERVKSDAGFNGDLAAFKAHLRTSPAFTYSDEATMLEAFERARATTEARLGALFQNFPGSELEFRFVPPHEQSTAPAAFYSPPAPGGTRPGLFYVNSFDLPSRPTYSTEALFLHEGLPGHHFQLSLAVENESLPAFRRHAAPVAFVEGWALYAETLGPELGLYDAPYKRFGALSFRAWRAARLVVDTGIHWMGWSREQAIAYLLDQTALSETEAIAEVERYIALPGQALGYMIGELKFLELRNRAEEALGEEFDIRRFHTALLEAGAMPLPILEESMDIWISDEAGRR